MKAEMDVTSTPWPDIYTLLEAFQCNKNCGCVDEKEIVAERNVNQTFKTDTKKFYPKSKRNGKPLSSSCPPQQLTEQTPTLTLPTSSPAYVTKYHVPSTPRETILHQPLTTQIMTMRGEKRSQQDERSFHRTETALCTTPSRNDNSGNVYMTPSTTPNAMWIHSRAYHDESHEISPSPNSSFLMVPPIRRSYLSTETVTPSSFNDSVRISRELQFNVPTKSKAIESKTPLKTNSAPRTDVFEIDTEPTMTTPYSVSSSIGVSSSPGVSMNSQSVQSQPSRLLFSTKGVKNSSPISVWLKEGNF